MSVTDVADRYVAALAQHEPSAAQAIGIPARALPDLSPEWYVARNELERATLAELDATEPVGRAETILHAALSERLRSNLALFATGFTTRLLAPLATPVHLIRESFDSVTVTDDAAGEAVIDRLERAPVALAEYERTLRYSRDHDADFSGTGVAGSRQVRAVATQLEGWLATDFYRAIPVESERLRARFEAAAEAQTAASVSFLRFLLDDLLPTAPETDAVGDVVYTATAQSFLGTELDLDELYDYGWSELHRLVAEAREVATAISGSPDLAATSALLDADPRYRLEGVEAIRGWLAQRIDAAIAQADGVIVTSPENIREVDAIVSAASAGVVYYSPGAPDGSTRSRVVWTLPGGSEVASSWQEVTSMHHEGVPGHHLEHAVNRANAELHPWQRYLCEVHGYAEGWAHYAEQVAGETGLIRDDAERLGLLLGQIWRAIRIVADIGLHTGRAVPPTPLTTETVWTPELARTLLTDYSMTDAHTARFEVDRYLGWPGQALAFKVGAKLWNETRQAEQDRQGADFDLVAFHDAALALGPMGLGPLRDLLDNPTLPTANSPVSRGGL